MQFKRLYKHDRTFVFHQYMHYCMMWHFVGASVAGNPNKLSLQTKLKLPSFIRKGSPMCVWAMQRVHCNYCLKTSENENTAVLFSLGSCWCHGANWGLGGCSIFCTMGCMIDSSGSFVGHDLQLLLWQSESGVSECQRFSGCAFLVYQTPMEDLTTLLPFGEWNRLCKLPSQECLHWESGGWISEGLGASVGLVWTDFTGRRTRPSFPIWLLWTVKCCLWFTAVRAVCGNMIPFMHS